MAQQSNPKTLLAGFFIGVLVLGAFLIGKYGSVMNASDRIVQTIKPVSKYEQCINTCIEVWQKNILSRAGDGANAELVRASCNRGNISYALDNYDKLYTELIARAGNPDIQDDSYFNSLTEEEQLRSACFMLVMNCRTTVCKDYL